VLSREELEERLAMIFELQADEDGFVAVSYPHNRLKEHFRLDTSYMDKFGFVYEGSSMHEDTRLVNPTDQAIPGMLFTNLNLADQLFEAALRLFGDSLLAYCESRKDTNSFRYYPPVIITFWSGFEAQVRFMSELLAVTVPSIPEQVKAYLLEYELVVNPRGEMVSRGKFVPVLDRYMALLRYGYGYSVDRRKTYWQRGEAARDLRNYFVHPNVRETRNITSDQVLNFMEDVLMLFIVPSCDIKRSVFLGQYRYHNMVTDLRELAFPCTEQPLFYDWQFRREFLTHCNFTGVDTSLFPNLRQKADLQREGHRNSDNGTP
jgi:hypothetical protein